MARARFQFDKYVTGSNKPGHVYLLAFYPAHFLVSQKEEIGFVPLQDNVNQADQLYVIGEVEHREHELRRAGRERVCPSTMRRAQEAAEKKKLNKS